MLVSEWLAGQHQLWPLGQTEPVSTRSRLSTITKLIASSFYYARVTGSPVCISSFKPGTQSGCFRSTPQGSGLGWSWCSSAAGSVEVWAHKVWSTIPRSFSEVNDCLLSPCTWAERCLGIRTLGWGCRTKADGEGWCPRIKRQPLLLIPHLQLSTKQKGNRLIIMITINWWVFNENWAPKRTRDLSKDVFTERFGEGKHLRRYITVWSCTSCDETHPGLSFYHCLWFHSVLRIHSKTFQKTQTQHRQSNLQSPCVNACVQPLTRARSGDKKQYIYNGQEILITLYEHILKIAKNVLTFPEKKGRFWSETSYLEDWEFHKLQVTA